MKTLRPVYTQGTHRLAPPQQTLERITPHLMKCGITRCADITGLDIDLGAPTYCAIRPGALVLQTSNGKGLTQLDAQVSALMEAIELHHAENPEPARLRRASVHELQQAGRRVIRPEELAGYYGGYFLEDYKIDWVAGEELVSQVEVWAPASAVYFCEPSLYKTSTNGLAAGNHLVEATLHALYELIERDAISRLNVKGRLQISEKCRVIDTRTVENAGLQRLIKQIEATPNQLRLLWAPSCVPIHTFWAILLNRTPASSSATFNTGYGAHLDPAVAAVRAITEAVQSRLTLIQGSREDIIEKPVYQAVDARSSAAYVYFEQLAGDCAWQTVVNQIEMQDQDLGRCCLYVLSQLAQAGHQRILRFELSKPGLEIPVVKVLIPSLLFDRGLF